MQSLGRLKVVKVQIKINPMCVPILLQKQVDYEVDHLLNLEILEIVEKPPIFVNPLNIASKKSSGGIGIFVNVRETSSAIILETYQILALVEIC